MPTLKSPFQAVFMSELFSCFLFAILLNPPNNCSVLSTTRRNPYESLANSPFSGDVPWARAPSRQNTVTWMATFYAPRGSRRPARLPATWCSFSLFLFFPRFSAHFKDEVPHKALSKHRSTVDESVCFETTEPGFHLYYIITKFEQKLACASHLLLTNNERERELTPTSFVHSSCQERFLSFSQLLCKRRFLLKKKRRIVRNPIFGWSRTEEKPVWCRVPPLGDRNVGTRRGAEEVGTFAMEAPWERVRR